jgi:hypothetical protein
MDIQTQTEILLREGGFDTWSFTGVSPAVICFESAALIGFVHVFATAEELLANWEQAQHRVLARHSAALRAAGAKAWNVYSIFLSEGSAAQQRVVERIEENFNLTRKIARSGIVTREDVEHALLPLTAIRSQPLISNSDFHERLRSRLEDVPEHALSAFLGSVAVEEVVEKIGAKV